MIDLFALAMLFFEQLLHNQAPLKVNWIDKDPYPTAIYILVEGTDIDHRHNE